MSNKSTKLGLGIIIGTVIGAVAGLLMSPGNGEANRKAVMKKWKKLKKIMDDGELESYLQKKYGEVSKEGIKLYQSAREELMKRMDEVKDDINQEKYEELVTKVVDSLKRDAKISADKLMELKSRLEEDWNDGDIEGEVVKKVKKTVKKSK